MVIDMTMTIGSGKTEKKSSGTRLSAFLLPGKTTSPTETEAEDRGGKLQLIYYNLL